MRSVARVLAAAVLAVGSICPLASYSDQPTAEPPVSPPPSAKPADRPLADTGDRAPLGLEVRYVDAHGKVVILEPQDFPHR